MARPARMEWIATLVSAHVLMGAMASRLLTTAESQQVSPIIFNMYIVRSAATLSFLIIPY